MHCFFIFFIIWFCSWVIRFFQLYPYFLSSDILETVKDTERNVYCSCGRNKKQNKVTSCQTSDKNDRGRKCPCISQGLSCGNGCRCKGCQNVENIPEVKVQLKTVSCRCGEGIPSTNIEHISCRDANRKSKCPCFKHKEPCGESCRCKNCKNIFGENDKTHSLPSSPVVKRKRSNPSPYKKIRSADFLIEHKCSLSSSVWSEYETCLLIATVNIIVSSLVPLSVNSTTTLYNHVVQSRLCEEKKLPIRIKKKTQIGAKLRQLEEKQNIVLANTSTILDDEWGSP